MKKSENLFWFGVGLGAGLSSRYLKMAAVPVLHVATPLLFGFLVRQKTIQDLCAELEASGRRLETRVMDMQPTRRNYKILNHIIGIERWGQSRLRVALGETFVRDEYDRYRPARSLSWNELQDQFRAARQETIKLGFNIETRGASDRQIDHNDLGRLTVPMWLFYLNLHARWEGLKLS